MSVRVREGGLDEPAVQALIRLHRGEALASTPVDNAHALDADGLRGASVRFLTAWDGTTLLGMAALKSLDACHAEIKSMRTAPTALRRGVARLLLTRLIELARAIGCERVSLETGTAPMFAPANALYEAFGFVDGAPFGGYPPSPHNRFMTMIL